MMTGPTIKELKQATDKLLVQLAGAARRMAVEATAKAAIWTLTGVRNLANKLEPQGVEIFPNIGFYSRPAADGKPEAIILNIGNAKLPVIVATRDEHAATAIRAALGTGKPAAGETIVFASTGGAVVYLKNDGTVEIRTAGGTAHRLPTIEDHEAFVAWAKNHIHTSGGAGNPTTTPTTDPPDPDGTHVLKGG